MIYPDFVIPMSQEKKYKNFKSFYPYYPPNIAMQ